MTALTPSLQQLSVIACTFYTRMLSCAPQNFESTLGLLQLAVAFHSNEPRAVLENIHLEKRPLSSLSAD